MVFPRAALDKTVPQLVLQLGAHLGDFVFLYPHSGNRWSGFTARIGLYGRDRQVVAGYLCVIVLFCFLFLLFAFNAPGSPPSSGAHWSVKPSKAPRLTEPDSFLQAEAGEVAAKVFQFKDHPRKSCFYTAGHPLWCGRFCPTGTSTERVSVYRWFIYDFFISV